jgi:glucosamine--fructose-6-phosphate aminotransferase (isomerizing)
VIALGQADDSEAHTRAAAAKLVELGATVWSTLELPGARLLPAPHTPSVLAPLCHVQSFYLAAHELAVARGLDPDAPPHLRKVTETL